MSSTEFPPSNPSNNSNETNSFEQANDGNDELIRLRFNGYCYSRSKQCLISADGKEIRLRSKSTGVFELLASKTNTVVHRDTIIEKIWPDVIASDDTVNQTIKEIRQALGDSSRTILETVPRKGFILNAEELPADCIDKNAYSEPPRKPFNIQVLTSLFFLSLLTGAYFASNSNSSNEAGDSPLSGGASKHGIHEGDKIEKSKNIDIAVRVVTDDEDSTGEQFARALTSSLSTYSNVNPNSTTSSLPDYQVELALNSATANALHVQLYHSDSEDLIYGNSFSVDSISSEMDALSAKIAAIIGSPAGGAIGQHLLNRSGLKSADDLTRPECLAHGYGCTNCSGEFDSVTPKAMQCLTNLLEENPADADAWALQSTVFSRQYLWGSALQEPLRSDQSKRKELQSKAIEAATRAEALSNGSNPSVYWGMAQAYLATCDADKMQMAVNRGLELNNSDPNMLGALGNFLSYVGKWDSGTTLVKKALEQDPRFVKKWWYMAIAKSYYRKGEYQTAYHYFIKSFDERNWLSHLQLTYTLPHLGRIEEAKQSMAAFMRLAPAMTREHVYEFYKSYCFTDDFLTRMKTAFDLVGMPSRGSGDDFSNIRPTHAKVEQIGDRLVEYIDVGEGVPLLFVHGSISDIRTWGYMQIPASENHRFLALSLRYFGTLDWPEKNFKFDLNQDAQDVIDFIEYKKLGPVYLVGWSRSGRSISLVAKNRPDLVKGTIIYEPVIQVLLDPKQNPNPPIDSQSPKFSKVKKLVELEKFELASKRFFEIALEKSPGDFELEPTMLQKVVLDNARTLTYDFSEHEPNQPNVNCEFINEITTPGLMLYGEDTNKPWQYMSTRYADCLPNGESISIADATHDGPISQPVKIMERISDFVNKIESQHQ